MPPTCWKIFFRRKTLMRIRWTFRWIATTMTPQRISIKALLHLLPFGCTNRKPTHDFPIPLQTKFCSICRRLERIPMSIYGTQIRPHVWRLTVDLGVKNDANQNGIPTFLFDFYTHYRPNFHRLATIHNAAVRWQTNRAIGIGGNAT